MCIAEDRGCERVDCGEVDGDGDGRADQGANPRKLCAYTKLRPALATTAMNGTPSTVPTDHHAVCFTTKALSVSSDHDRIQEMQRPPQISQALLQGALEISAIFERRVTDLRADYENIIRALVQERDALLARSNANTGPEVNGPLIEELEALRMQSESWRQERAQLERTLADYTNERANSAQERARLEQECEELRQAREELQNERTALLQECGRIQSEKDIKLQESQEIITAKDASIQELEARVRWLESIQAASPSQPPTVLDVGPCHSLNTAMRRLTSCKPSKTNLIL